MADKYQEEKLREEILGDAKVKAERNIARANNEAQKYKNAAQDEINEKREARLKEANDDADAKCHAIMVEVQRESNRHWLLNREKCIDEMFAEALKEASSASGERRAKSFEQLAFEAISAIGAAKMRVIFNSADANLVTLDWLRSIAEKALGESASNAEFTLEPSEKAAAGIVFETVDGKRSFDNSYASRLAKMKDDLRIALTI